jgi:hypothetical protein
MSRSDPQLLQSADKHWRQIRFSVAQGAEPTQQRGV